MDDTTEPVLITASDIPEPPLCCQQSHERGYRHGYRHGYVYALYDMGAHLRFPDRLWQHIECFLSEVITPWVQRARYREGEEVRLEDGPRFSKKKLPRQKEKTHAL